MTTQCVQVKLELGHKALIRAKPTAEGFTHDWTVFVRGPENYNIQHFVEKVVFNLHESFPKPKRVVKEPPYQVSESGYAGFVLPIDVYFKNKEEPKKVRFDYDLFLHLEGPPVNHSRYEKLTFQNPTEDFRRKLIKSGGVGILGPDGGTVLGQQGPGTEEVSTGEIIHPTLQAPCKSKSSPDIVRKHKSTSAGKVQESKPSVTASTTSTPAVSEPFVSVFGQPIKANKPSPDPKKSKDASGRSSSSKSSKSGSSSSSRDRLPSPSSNSREGKTSSLKDGKPPPVKENLNKTGGKRPPLPTPSLPSSATSGDSKSTNKENKGSTMKRPPSPLTPPPSDTSKDGKKRKSSSSSNSSKKPKEKHQSEKKGEKVKEKESHKKKDVSQSSSHSKVPKDQDTKNVSEGSSSSKSKTVDKENKTGNSKKKNSSESEPPSKPKFHKETSLDSAKSATDNSSKGSKQPASVEQRNSNSSSLDDSPDSSISFSSLQISGKRGPLGALMAEMGDQDDDDELVSPLSSDPPSPPHFSSQDTPAVKVEPMELSPKHEKVEKKSSKHSKTAKIAPPADLENSSRDKTSNSNDSSTGLHNVPVGTCESDLNKLVALQRHLMLLTDRDLVQKVVDLIEETRQYNVSSSTFDFDLCSLDKETVNKIYVCLGKPEPVTS